jgi:signal transduction histidine kinase
VIRHVQVLDRLRRHPVVGDLLLALTVAAAGIKTAFGGHESNHRLAIGLAVAATLPIALRRVYPRLVFVVIGSATFVAAIGYDSYWAAGAIVAFYTIGAHLQRREAAVYGLTGLVALGLAIASIGGGGWTSTITLLRLAPFVAAWILGDNLRTRRAYLRALEERAAQLEREQEANSRRAAAEEQTRIAREVHDIVAHNLSVIVVQSTAADAVFDSQPDEARRAVRTIEATARRALDELRRVLGVVRSDEEAIELAPQPGLAAIEALADNVRAAGLDVGVDVAGSPCQLPPAFQLSVYRIVQEALTNTLRHADARHATVSLGFDPDELTVEIVDDGVATPGNGAGRGLLGMRERAAVFGGTVEAGPAEGGGYRVAARLPLSELR